MVDDGDGASKSMRQHRAKLPVVIEHVDEENVGREITKVAGEKP
jgi:PII-like signaling protein